MEISKGQKKLIEKEVLALASSDLKDKPNVVAVACCRVVGKSKILITDNFMSKTRKNLLKNNKVAIAVWSRDGEEGYQFKDRAWKKIVDKDPNNKDLAHKAAVLVTVNEIWDLANTKLLAKR